MAERETSVLAVEDDAVDRLAVKRGLELHAGYRVVVADDVASAFARLDEETFDAAVVDWTLPDGDALDFLAQVETRALRLPTVVLTGHDDDERARIALERGAQDYLIKGAYTPDSLVRALRYAMERARSEEFRARLHHADRLVSLGNLAAGICHEINNPMAWLLANMEFIKERLVQASALESSAKDDELQRLLRESHEMIDESETGLRRIAKTASALRDYARLNSEHVDSVDINGVIRAAVRVASHEVKHRAEIELHLAPDLPLIAADSGSLQQVFINLLLNAGQAIDTATGSSAKIRVTSERQGGQIVCRVEDSGPGIPPRVRDMIFAPFFTTKTRTKGTGLGLAISRDIVSQYDGSIALRSGALSGACFEIRLPFTTGSSVESIAVVRAPEELDSSARILVVDDEPSILRMMQRFLRGYQVEATHDVDEALSHLAKVDFDAVICDLNLRPKSGADLYLEMTRRWPHMMPRLTMMTGGAVTPELRRFEATASVNWLKKPFDRRTLQAAVQRGVTDRRRASTALVRT